eukprot:UN04467
MALFTANPEQFTRAYSDEFMHEFMMIFKNQGGRRVMANVVYRQYIKDREHFHMNATIWQTLSSFATYLGKKEWLKLNRLKKLLDR